MSGYMLNGNGEKGPCVLVLGAMAADAKGQPAQSLQAGSSTPGIVRLGIGGVGRNIAENLARMGIHTILLSAIGDYSYGHNILEVTSASGVDTTHVLLSDEHHTGAYIAILDQMGAPALAIDDMTVIETLTPAIVYRKRRLFREASMVVLDANVPPQTIQTAFKLAQRYNVPVCVDPTSAILAQRFHPYLADIHLMTPNLHEAQVLVGQPAQAEPDIQQLTMQLVGMGVEIAIITLSEMGLYYATSNENGRVPALNCDVVDLTGAGDALTAAVIFGLLNHFPIGEAVRLGISAAALTIQCHETVCSDLSLDRLYDELVI